MFPAYNIWPNRNEILNFLLNSLQNIRFCNESFNEKIFQRKVVGLYSQNWKMRDVYILLN